jgi:hypothetical protein
MRGCADERGIEITEFNEIHREVLTAVCDTVIPAVAHDPDPDGFFARTASQVQVPQVIEQMLSGMPDDQRLGLLSLLEALADQGFGRSSRRSREQIMRNVTLMGPEAAAGIGALTNLTLFLHYGLPDEQGQNPSWRTFGYPGPVSPAVGRPADPAAGSGGRFHARG